MQITAEIWLDPPYMATCLDLWRAQTSDEDPVGSVDFGHPDPLIFFQPDPDPTCNNGFIKLFSS